MVKSGAKVHELVPTPTRLLGTRRESENVVSAMHSAGDDRYRTPRSRCAYFFRGYWAETEAVLSVMVWLAIISVLTECPGNYIAGRQSKTIYMLTQ